MGTQTKTLAEQVANGIMNLIQETPYKAGDKLPTEKELCERTGAGRNTVREALKILASRNVLEIRQGAGTFVSEKQGIPDDPLGFSMVNDHVKLTKDLLQVRIMLEPQIAALAAQCAKEHEIKELEEILEEMEAAMKKREDYSELDTKFHTKIAQCTHNIVMENLLPVIGKVWLFLQRRLHRQNMTGHGSRIERSFVISGITSPLRQRWRCSIISFITRAGMRKSRTDYKRWRFCVCPANLNMKSLRKFVG